MQHNIYGVSRGCTTQGVVHFLFCKKGNSSPIFNVYRCYVYITKHPCTIVAGDGNSVLTPFSSLSCYFICPFIAKSWFLSHQRHLCGFYSVLLGKAFSRIIRFAILQFGRSLSRFKIFIECAWPLLCLKNKRILRLFVRGTDENYKLCYLAERFSRAYILGMCCVSNFVT